MNACSNACSWDLLGLSWTLPSAGFYVSSPQSLWIALILLKSEIVYHYMNHSLFTNANHSSSTIFFLGEWVVQEVSILKMLFSLYARSLQSPHIYLCITWKSHSDIHSALRNSHLVDVHAYFHASLILIAFYILLTVSLKSKQWR